MLVSLHHSHHPVYRILYRRCVFRYKRSTSKRKKNAIAKVLTKIQTCLWELVKNIAQIFHFKLPKNNIVSYTLNPDKDPLYRKKKTALDLYSLSWDKLVENMNNGSIMI